MNDLIVAFAFVASFVFENKKFIKEPTHQYNFKETDVDNNYKSNSLNFNWNSISDSTQLLGTWTILEADKEILEYWYVGDMPETFAIESTEQLKDHMLKIKIAKGSYSFLVNKIDLQALELTCIPWSASVKV